MPLPVAADFAPRARALILISRKQDRKFGRRLRLIRFFLAFSRTLRSRYIRRLLDRLCYFDRDGSRSLEFVLPYHDHLLIFFDVRSYIEQRIFYHGYFEREVIDFLQIALKPGCVALDVGANIGCHSLVMADLVGDSGRVLAFEPHPGVSARLRANIHLNCLHNVEVVPVALSSESGSQLLFAPTASASNQGQASLYRQNLDTECEEIRVPTATLDQIVDDHKLRKVDLMKIDVEGHEYQVLRGARRTLARFKPVLVFEFSDKLWRSAGVTLSEVEAYLGSLGYALFVLRQGLIASIKHGVLDGSNLLAVPTFTERSS